MADIDAILAKIDTGNSAGIVAEQELAAEVRRLREELETARECIRAWVERNGVAVTGLLKELTAERERVKSAYIDGFTAGANAIEEQDETEYPSDPDVAYAQSKYGKEGG